jgi:probable F420-dependent oxidoreductase
MAVAASCPTAALAQECRAVTSPTRPTRPTLSLSLPSFGTVPDGGWRALLDAARAAEDAGIDRIALPDHVTMGPNTHEYAWGRFPTPPEADWLEPITTLTAIAAVTTRVRLATGILIAPLRPAALLAKAVATLDVISGGRVDLGVGTGWQREEYDAQGLDFAARGRLLTDTIGACRALWEQMPASFTSASVSFSDVYCAPQPVQRPLPVWFSGVLHDRNLRRVVELGDGWIPIMNATLDDIRAGGQRLRAAFAAAGRSTDMLHVRGTPMLVRADGGGIDLGATMATVPQLVAAGCTDVYVHGRAVCADLADAPRVFPAVARAFDAVTSAR